MTQLHASAVPERASLRARQFSIFSLLFSATCLAASAQSGNTENLALKVQQLTEAMDRAQKSIERSQRDLELLRSQLATLQQQLAESHNADAQPSGTAELSAAVEQIREQQSLAEAQIATHEQSKVESESKYPVKLSGLVLLTGFVNTSQMDDPVTPSMALAGSGSTGASLRQTVLGFDARGPQLFNARTHADARVDFDGAGLSGGGGTNAYAGGLLRLRTAHADLNWQHSQVFFSLDHPIIAPNTPASLTAVALPALGWSGNLWTWNPQVGITQDLRLNDSQRFRVQAALIDVMNPAQIYTNAGVSSGVVNATTAENSRWPGAEGRIAFLGGAEDTGIQLGIGGLFAPHRTPGGTRFNSWAGTFDYRIPLPGRVELSGSGYAGEALGGLGGGAFKDYVFSFDPIAGYSFQNLHDYGGWAQIKERASQHLEFNAALGTDQVPAAELRPYAGDALAYYLNLARNLTYTGNVIYKPSAYLMFSLEYRHLQSSPVNEYSATGNVIGIATGYRF
jgi:hypothetical protein